MERDKLTSEFLSLVAVEDYEQRYAQDISGGRYFGFPLEPIIAVERRLCESRERALAYFSMEYGLATSRYNTFSSSRAVHERNKGQEQEIFSNFRLADYFFSLPSDPIIDLPIYSGGLGVLAGDTAKTMADYKLPSVCVGMLWNAGYFRQRFWFKYGQAPEEMHWDHASFPGLIPLKNRVVVTLRSKKITLRIWKYYCYSYTRDACVPLVLLDSNIEENDEASRPLTDQLYKSDNAWIKIMQRVILGMGGAAALRELGYQIDTFHLNEGHAIFAFVEQARQVHEDGMDELGRHFVYTCHTPVAAGHDRFGAADLRQILTDDDFTVAERYGTDGDLINLTRFSMNAASRINAVSRCHQQVMHLQFPEYRDRIQYVTNGVHHHTWASESFKRLFRDFAGPLGDISANPMALEKVRSLKEDRKFREAVWLAHQQNKKELCDMLKQWGLDEHALTLCWARRVAAYKRPSLILKDVKKLIQLTKKQGPLQIIFAGKAHPKDDLGFTFINEMLDTIDGLTGAYSSLKIIMLENYSIPLAQMLTSSVDVWLNNPLPPFEASGTSGMKAVLNGVLQLSTVDGWIAEVHDRPIGRFFGYRNPEGTIGDERDLHIADDARQLYAALAQMTQAYYECNNKGVIDLQHEWIDMMIECLGTAARFNTYRMLDEYIQAVWKRSAPESFVET